jgi:hypothetical protein
MSINSSLLARAALACLSAWAMSSAPAHAAANVGVSINVSQPGFYGRIDIGDQPAPTVIYQQPMIIQQAPMAIYQRPIYLRVPPAHHQQWARYCNIYRACGQPVYFVQDRFVQPGYRHDERRRGDNRERREDRREDRRDDRREDRRDDRGGFQDQRGQQDQHWNDQRGHGNGKDHGRH